MIGVRLRRAQKRQSAFVLHTIRIAHPRLAAAPGFEYLWALETSLGQKKPFLPVADG
jgi:hypothetical protein